MRILLVGDYRPDPRLGSTKVLVKLQEAFKALGHECDLLLGEDIGTFPRNRHLRQAFAPVAAWSAVRRAVRSRGPYDVVDVASAEGRWIASCRAGLNGAAVISRSNGLEHLNYQRMVDDHDAGIARKPWTRRVFYPAVRLPQVAAAARAADRVLLLNPADRAFAVGRGWKAQEHIDIVPHGVSERFLQRPPVAGAPRGAGILFCGSWTAVKGVTYLVDAVDRLATRRKAVALTVLGGGISPSDIRAAFSSEARRHLTILERAPEDVVMQAYRSHDVLAWPSTYEGFGMVVVEAMSQRLPVVATPVGCAQTLVVPDDTGLLVPPRDPAALAAALDRVLSEPTLGPRLAEAAYRRVQHMSWTYTAACTLEVYERAIAARAHVH